MLKRINDFLAGLPMTIAGGVFLIFSFFLPRAGIELPVDPAWATVVICGIPLLYLGIWRIIYNRGISKISSALLIDMAMIAAIAIGDLFAAGEVAFIMEIGAILEDMTTERAKKGLKKLISLAPAQGRRITENGEEMIPAKQIQKDDILRILPGETIPVDGVIVSGETSVDQSVMTGESLPVDKGVGESVFCGTINRFGSIDIRATRVGEDSSLQKLIRMVAEAENKKAPMARIADKAASWLVPAALGIAILAGLVTQNIVRAVTVMVVFCPCALVLATPTAVMAAIGQATRHGVIIKSGEALERMGKADTIAFDKTGTLTYGRLEVCDVIPCGAFAGADAPQAPVSSPNADAPQAPVSSPNADALQAPAAHAKNKSEHPLGKAAPADSLPVAAVSARGKSGNSQRQAFSADALLALAASAESKSEHPLGKAIVAAAKAKNLALKTPETFTMSGGRGVAARLDGQTILCGSERYLQENNISVSEEVQTRLQTLREQGKASVLAARNGSCIGIIALSDVMRETAPAMVKKLSEMGTKTVLLTGDNRKTADYFAGQAGITEVYAGLLPEEKVSRIAALQESGRKVCMIGDGVNDAPALKTADVGAAMGGMGSDIAVEAADIALMSDDISRIPYLKRLSQATVNTIRFSITLSMCINFAAVTCSVLGILNPTTGALVHNAGSCLVVLIAALLYDPKSGASFVSGYDMEQEP